MFWDRKDLKMKGKIAFKANYWKSVLVAFLATLALGASSSFTGKQDVDDLGQLENGIDGIANGDFDSIRNIIGGFTDGQALLFAGVAIIVVILIATAGIALKVFLLNPLKVSCDNFFLLNRKDPKTELDALSRGFKANYSNVIMTIFMRDLFVFLWTLLFIIPGIIKGYEYRLVTYILAENPDMKYKDALKLSGQLMNGQKWKAFVLDLSFIGWYLLSVLTAGILNIFYVQPYVQATDAELYVALAHPEKSGEVLKFGNAQADTQTVEFEAK